MSLTIGLTGSIASGKSTVANMFEQFNIPIVDADKIAREVVEPGEVAYEKIVDTFGREILQSNQEIDRKKLGSIVFSDETERKKLNNIVHPAIRKEMLRQKEDYIASGEQCVVMDIPLLFESKLFHFVDQILVVYVDEQTQLRRLMNRDQSTEEEARQRINSQISLKEKAEQADAVIDNSGTKEESLEQLKEVLIEWDVI